MTTILKFNQGEAQTSFLFEELLNKTASPLADEADKWVPETAHEVNDLRPSPLPMSNEEYARLGEIVRLAGLRGGGEDFTPTETAALQCWLAELRRRHENSCDFTLNGEDWVSEPTKEEAIARALSLVDGLGKGLYGVNGHKTRSKGKLKDLIRNS